MPNLFYISEYIYYTLSSLNKYRIHSPFVFKLVTEVFEKEVQYSEYESIEKIRDTLKEDDTVLEVIDLGAGSRSMKSSKRKISTIAKKSVKKEKYGHLLFMLTRYFKASSILELGTSLGITTSYLATAQPNSKVITIEGSESIAGVAAETFRKLGLGNIQLVVGNFDTVLKEVCNDQQQFDIIFIDGNHREIPTIEYFKTVLPYTHNDTVLIFDDIHWSEEMQEAWEFIKNHPQVKLTIDIFEMGIVFLRKENREKEHMRIRY